MAEDSHGDDASVTEQTCGVCLEEPRDPLDLPCGHSFCEGCLNEWRSRYGVEEEMRRKCPICRARIPPSKEMVTALFAWRAAKQSYEDVNETSSEIYHETCRLLKEAEDRVGADWDGVTVLEDNNDKPPVVMPKYIVEAMTRGDIKSVLKWLNANQAEDRTNAISSTKLMSLPALTIASAWGCSELMSLLLQRGADVDLRANEGNTAISLALSAGMHKEVSSVNDAVRLLLSWGASFFPGELSSREDCISLARRFGNMNLQICWSPSSGEGGARSSIYHLGPSSTARRVSQTNTCPTAISTR